EALRLWIEAPRATYVAERDGEIVGTYYLKTNQPGLGSHVCNAGYMVRSEARGEGVGKAMCTHSLEEARRLGYKAMQYNLVAATNRGAVDLWRKMGFEIVGTLPKAFNHARLGLVDAHVMYRLLTTEELDEP
ncbi:MAG TPA: GNAT family N-acetyltransferase, partial [Anaerolineae bacterium]|nr:GNAT family N-acetyltransferase [Anaerolineae bacterium]